MPSVSSTAGSGIPIRNSLKSECSGAYTDTTQGIIGINSIYSYIQVNGFSAEDNANFLSIVQISKINDAERMVLEDALTNGTIACKKEHYNISTGSKVTYGLSIPTISSMQFYQKDKKTTIPGFCTYKEANDTIYVSPQYGVSDSSNYVYDLMYCSDGSNWDEVKSVPLKDTSKVVLFKDKIVFPDKNCVENPNASPAKPSTNFSAEESESINEIDQNSSGTRLINTIETQKIIKPPVTTSYVSRTTDIIFKIKIKRTDSKYAYPESPWYTPARADLQSVRIICNRH